MSNTDNVILLQLYICHDSRVYVKINLVITYSNNIQSNSLHLTDQIYIYTYTYVCVCVCVILPTDLSSLWTASVYIPKISVIFCVASIPKHKPMNYSCLCGGFDYFCAFVSACNSVLRLLQMVPSG